MNLFKFIYLFQVNLERQDCSDARTSFEWEKDTVRDVCFYGKSLEGIQVGEAGSKKPRRVTTLS